MKGNRLSRKLELLLAAVIMTMISPGKTLAVEVKVVTPKELRGLFEKVGRPQYPYEARRGHITGAGLFRMYVNPDGRVRAVGVMKSTGNKDLDLAAAAGLYQSRIKPGRSREIDMPITFTMSR